MVRVTQFDKRQRSRYDNSLVQGLNRGRDRAERDFDLMARMGHNSHRLSVEWSRIEPEEGVFDFSNAITREMVERYAPEALAEILGLQKAQVS